MTKKMLLSLLSTLLLISYSNQMLAQNETTSKKKIVIISKTIDENGNEVVNKEVIEGEAAEAYKLEELKGEDSNEVDVNIEDDGNGKVKRVIKIRKKTEGGNVEEIELDDDGSGLKIIDKDGNIIITEKLPDDENVEVEKTVEVKDGVITETIIKRQRVANSNKVFLGVALAKSPNEGVLIDQVIKDSPAEKAGLKNDDLITHINKVAVNSLDELTKALAPLKPNDSAAITYQRDGKNRTATAILVENKNIGKFINVWKTDDGETIDLNGKEYKVIIKEEEN